MKRFLATAWERCARPGEPWPDLSRGETDLWAIGYHQSVHIDHAPPSNEDIGRVAAGVLADPTPHIGKCYRPTGPQLLAPRDIAEILTGVVGRTVKYQEVTLKMFLKAATAQGVSP